MKLTEWLNKNAMKEEEFGKLAEISQSSVNRIKKSTQFPSPKTIRKIYMATGGEVTANDLAGIPEQPKRTGVETKRRGRG